VGPNLSIKWIWKKVCQPVEDEWLMWSHVGFGELKRTPQIGLGLKLGKLERWVGLTDLTHLLKCSRRACGRRPAHGRAPRRRSSAREFTPISCSAKRHTRRLLGRRATECCWGHKLSRINVLRRSPPAFVTARGGLTASRAALHKASGRSDLPSAVPGG
jgi:hypothetical protein